MGEVTPQARVVVPVRLEGVHPGRDFRGAQGKASDIGAAIHDDVPRLNLGKADAVMYAADLTEDYVDFNKGDVTDPTTLGG